ncbi:MAG TPA: cyclopropane-fatty-acyl-phospholipid synthase family protein [Candidatus Limnocylindrales bacterium]|nr:cyclopropane-fatty-acyl-phospholipid synthase family protein [Candidatus Limnocylindrales bacterium]
MNVGTERSISRPASMEALRANTIDRTMLRTLARALGDAPIRLELWDGSRALAAGAAATYRVLIRTRAALAGLLTDPQLQFGEHYTAGDIEVEGGSLADAMTAVYAGVGEPRGLRVLLDSVCSRLSRISPVRARGNVHHHYDIGNDFYRLWLDERMVYTCAYFPTPDATLEQAQLAKLDHVCRKLRLRPGEEVIEAGCGWGALALHMAQKYGVRVRAFNVSRTQIAYAREQAHRFGLSGRVQFIEDDYRSATGTCDAFVSVGMLEHVGLRQYRELGSVIRRLLSANGRGFIHSIGRYRPMPTNAWIRRRIFPDGYTPAPSEMSAIFEPNGLAILDMENLRRHYALTLEHWTARYEQAVPVVRRMFDEKFVRTWRLYLAGSTAAFRTGSMHLYQILFDRSGSDSTPWTRDDIYAPG